MGMLCSFFGVQNTRGMFLIALQERIVLCFSAAVAARWISLREERAILNSTAS